MLPFLAGLVFQIQPKAITIIHLCLSLVQDMTEFLVYILHMWHIYAQTSLKVFGMCCRYTQFDGCICFRHIFGNSVKYKVKLVVFWHIGCVSCICNMGPIFFLYQLSLWGHTFM